MHTMLYGGSRCVSGDTILDGHTKTIKELSDALEPVFVYTSHGVQIAEPPFKKGYCEMIIVETECGEKITVTPDHRFWNGVDWVKACSLSCGSDVAVRTSHQTLLQSSSGFSLSEFLSSVPHLKEKLEDCQGGYCEHPHQYGLRLLQFLAFFQAYRALQFYVQGHNHLDHCEYLRELNIHKPHIGLRELACNQNDHTSLHLSMMDDFPSSCHISQFSDPFFLQIYELFQVQLENDLISLGRITLPRSCELAFRSFFDRCGLFFFRDNFSSDIPSVNGYELKRVKLSTKTAKQDFYTLHVPNCQQYYANGFLNHNSGKTFISVRNVIARAAKKKSRHLIGKTFFNQVKTAIGMDTLPKVMDICFPDMKYELNKTDWFVTLPNGSEIWLCGFDNSERVDKILGKEYSTIYFNESTDIEEETVETLLTRLAENSGLELKAYYDCNPKSRKHWTYTWFFKGETQSGSKLSDPDDYCYLKMNPKDNVENLNPKYLKLLEGMSEKKRIRFLEGDFQDDIEGALWSAEMIEKAKNKKIKEIKKTVIAIDPAVTNDENSDLTGIMACGIDINNEGVVIDDYSGKFTPNDWAQRAVNAYNKHEAAYIVAEVNQGGDMVEAMIHNIDKNIKVKKVRASKGKFARAEPVAAFYERFEVRHCEGLDELETEMCEYVPLNSKKSPDRLDAMVWGFTDLIVSQSKSYFMA